MNEGAISSVIGRTIAHYKITSAIGAGGMGEVYRATDTKLGRDVALKVLPAEVAQDPERVARFRREAQVLASLNHPNIAHIHGLEESQGTLALVMELVEGPTLAERIGRGPVGAVHEPPPPMDDALHIAKQIADALEAAHEKGIIHRDLKPANVKITPEGAVKVLDFGLAKAMEDPAASSDPANSPTISIASTRAGVIMGTAAYMAPEQARGHAVDRRADIWSFGVVLFEMLAGRQAFEGETTSDILAAVLKFEPDWPALPPTTPPSIIKLLHRCLTKDRKKRLQSIGEARIAIEETLAGDTGILPVTVDRQDTHAKAGHGQDALATWLRAAPWVLAGLLTIAVVVLSIILGKSVPHPSAMHFRAVTNFAGVQAQPSLSPDGRSVAFVSNRDGHYNIYVGLISGGSLIQITKDANLKSHPAWSPDGGTIAFARLNKSGIWDIWQIASLGGTPRRLVLNAMDPTWSPDGHSLAYTSLSTGTIWVSNASGQGAHQLTSPASGRTDTEPRYSPDGRKLAFAARGINGAPYGELAVADVDSGKVQLLTRDSALAISPAWSADSRYIYFASSRGGTMNIWKVNADGGELSQVTAGAGDDAELDVSADGKRLVFSTLRMNTGLAQWDLQAKPGEQSVKPLTTDPARNEFAPTYSPDGKHLAYFTNLKGAENEGIQVSDADGSNAEQLVQDARVNIFPCWTPDGKNLVYMSMDRGKGEYRSIPILGGAPQSLAAELGGFPDIGRDGRMLILSSKGQVQAFDPRDGKTQTLFSLPHENSWLLHWSPDEQSIAYMVESSKENDPEAGVWVNDFKNPPRQIFHGWVVNYTRGPGNEIYVLEGKPDLNAVLWKVDWDGQGLARTPATLPILYNFNYHRAYLINQFGVSPDGRYLAFQTQQVLEENIGMIENVH